MSASSNSLLYLYFITFLLTLSLITTPITPFSFDLDARNYKCFTEELPTNFDVYGEYQVDAGFSQFVDFRVTDSMGHVVIDRKDVSEGDFSFVAREGGDYSFCWYNRLTPGVPYHRGMARRVTFDVLTGTETHDYHKLARKEHLKPIEINLKMMEDIVVEIYQEYEYFIEREHRMQQTTQAIHSRSNWLSVLCVVFAAVFAVGQVWYLQNYFVKKRVVRASGMQRGAGAGMGGIGGGYGPGY